MREAVVTRSSCPITLALDIFGDKWSLIIVRDLLFKQKKYYGEFLNAPEKISTNILANRLLKLEKAEIIIKGPDRHNASRSSYHLSEKGKDLIPLMLEMARWSAGYDPARYATSELIEGAPERLLERFAGDREALIEEIRAGLEP